MLNYDLSNRLHLKAIPQNILLNHTFGDDECLWQKNKSHLLPEFEVKSFKKYPYIKYGKIFGFEVQRYLCVYHNYLCYFDEQDTLVPKGFCDLKNRYIEWHQTQSGKFVLVISNTTEISIFFFQKETFWIENSKQINIFCIKTNYYRQFQQSEILGEGTFSLVMEAKNKRNGKTYAAKKIDKNNKNHKSTKNLIIEQRKILNNLMDYKHTSHLIQFYQQNNQYILILQKIQGTDLFKFFQSKANLDLYQLKTIITSILQCLQELHKAKIIHRDIKPQNIQIDSQYKCKIIDFGLSVKMASQIDKKSLKKCGTIGYMAPQVLLNQFSIVRPYNQKCDLFSVGIIVHMLLLGNNPIKGKSYEQTYQLNRQCNIVLDKSKIAHKYGNKCVQFLQKLLQKNPKHRYCASEALKSSFLQDEQIFDQSLTLGRKLSTSTIDEKRKWSQQYFLK